MFQERDWPFPVLQQGDAPRPTLLEDFRRAGNAVLVGSHSFWEGIDVKGDALTLVVIDKLPFAPPDDPVLAARIDALNPKVNALVAMLPPDDLLAQADERDAMLARARELTAGLRLDQGAFRGELGYGLQQALYMDLDGELLGRDRTADVQQQQVFLGFGFTY